MLVCGMFGIRPMKNQLHSCLTTHFQSSSRRKEALTFSCWSKKARASLRRLQRLAGLSWRLGKWCLPALLCGVIAAGQSARAAVVLAANSPAPLVFAGAEIDRAAAGKTGLPGISFTVEGQGEPQSYHYERNGSNLRVIGADAVGAMYGGLDVAEAIRLGTLTELPMAGHKPFLTERGIKFNIPLDLRTPSYSDSGDAFQANIPEMWSLDFWREFLDEMARQRFNVLSLWNLHPFPSIVKVPEYPDVALADVWRTTMKLDDSFDTSGVGFVRPPMLAQHEVLKKLTIEEKIAFWRKVMQMAKDRGVDVYWFTWNVFLYGAEGVDGLTRANPGTNVINYFRASVRETVKTYPLLAGMGITAGESMPDRIGGLNKEEWLWQSYGEGIRDGLKDEPGRKFRMIHRFHQSNLDDISRFWKDYPGPFDFSYKYAVAHMYGMTNPPFIKPLLAELSPTRRSWLTVRNDDIYSFRWGDPQFARDFVRAIPGPDKIAGFYMGCDGYCWGREAMDLEPAAPRQLVMQKQWFSFMLWGRLSYDPTLPDEFFQKTLAVHFPEAPADKLLAAWSAASQVFPEITRFFWGNVDTRWFPEACISHKTIKGFYTVRHFIEGETMPESGNLTIREWRDQLQKNQGFDGATPLQVAANLRKHAAAARQGVTELRPKQGADKELRLTLGDLEAFADLGDYYADKIEGACELALFDSTKDTKHQAASVQHLEAALGHWRDYAKVYSAQYKQPLLYNRIGEVDIPKLVDKVSADVEIARNWKTGTIGPAPRRRTGGSIYGQ